MKIKFSTVLSFTLTMAAMYASAGEFTLSSLTLQNNGVLPAKQFANTFGCTGQNISPALNWVNPPAGTKSYVVTAYDPDAPTGSGWWHWVVANLPATSTILPEGAGNSMQGLPEGAITIENDARQASFLGACPPEGEKHRYIFTVHALKVPKLDLPANATPALVGFMVHFQQVGEAKLMVWGSR